LKKPLYLFLALLFPGLIFVFLKYAGKNEFAVPVFYENGITPLTRCSIKTDSARDFSFKKDEKPFKIDITFRAMWSMNKEVNVLVFRSDNLDFDKVKLAIEDELGKDVAWFNEAETLVTDTTGLARVKKCNFFVNEPFQSVLIDKEGKIRGYYDLRKREEIDKLRVELKILLKRY